MNHLTIGLLGGLLFALPAYAQGRPPKPLADPCAPIGKTADGRLVYALACERIPVATIPQTSPGTTAPAAAAPEEDSGGLFRNPFPSIIRPTDVQRSPGVGPAGSAR